MLLQQTLGSIELRERAMKWKIVSQFGFELSLELKIKISPFVYLLRDPRGSANSRLKILNQKEVDKKSYR